MRSKMLTVVLAGLLGLIPALAWADAVPNLLAWQGVALDEGDIPLASGTYDFTFSIFDDPVGGNLMWQETQTVLVTNGLVNVLLGSNNPIPDTAFNGNIRYLQVQFESEAPYAPRTRIVSVGYAFRVATLDGATGGTISNGTSSITEIHGTTSGGRIELLDELEQIVASLGADPDGDGGSLTIFSDPASGNGFSLDGNALGSGSPTLSLVGSGSAFDVDGSVSGDGAVELPVGAVSSPEIADEPGVSGGVRGGSVLGITANFVTLAATTATYPSDGFALIVAQTIFRAHEGNTWVDGVLLEGGSEVESWYWDPGDPDKWFDQNQSHIFVQPVSAGTHTYELKIRQGSGTVDALNSRLMVLYFPTAYGTVSGATPMSLSSSPTTGVQAEPTTASALDVSTERSESILENDLRVNSELAAMKARMSALETELREARALIEAERDK